MKKFGAHSPLSDYVADETVKSRLESCLKMSDRGDYDPAVEELSEIIKEEVEKHEKNDMHPDFAPLYFANGDILLRQAQAQSDIF